MKILGKVIGVAAVLLSLGFAQGAQAQTIDDPASCRSIGGSWMAANPPQRENPAAQRYGRCSLRSSYTVPRNTTLRVEIGVELAVTYGGRLNNDGHIELPNTAALIVVGGRFFNNGTLYADNRGEIWYFLGQFVNSGSMDVEGDLFTEPLWTPQPQSPTDCLDNRGSLRLFSGGNMHNRGCIDSLLSSGMLNMDATATLHNYAQAHFRTGPNDVISGRINNYKEGYVGSAGQTIVTAGAHIENDGSLKIERGELRIEDGATMATNRGGVLTLAGGDFRLDGTYTLKGGVTNATGGGGAINPDNMMLGATGQFLVEGGSTVWAQGNVDIENEGLILLDCLVFWYPPMSLVGNSLFFRTCRPVPIKPPRTLF
ncbi:MAG: hypothetical protein AAF004_12880 [Pseudomonadota bacterium]